MVKKVIASSPTPSPTSVGRREMISGSSHHSKQHHHNSSGKRHNSGRIQTSPYETNNTSFVGGGNGRVTSYLHHVNEFNVNSSKILRLSPLVPEATEEQILRKFGRYGDIIVSYLNIQPCIYLKFIQTYFNDSVSANVNTCCFKVEKY